MDCKSEGRPYVFQGHNSDLLQHLPSIIAMQFPAHVTCNIAVSNTVVNALMRHARRGHSFASFASDLSEAHKAEYDKQRVLYYEYGVQDRRAQTIYGQLQDRPEHLPVSSPNHADSFTHHRLIVAGLSRIH
jgi:hypothetical protein